MSNLMLTLDDAVKVYKQLVEYDQIFEVDEETEEIVRQEFEQKCWINECDDPPMKQLWSAVMDINPKEICSQIEMDHLTEWCDTMQAFMQMELVKMRR